MNIPIAEYADVLRSRWRWVVWGMLLALLATTAYLLVEPPMYRTHATVFVRTPGDVSSVVDGGNSYAQGRARTYAALASSTDLASRVAADLGLDIQPAAMARRIAATNPPGTTLIEFAVSAPSAAESERTATVLLNEYSTTVRDLEAVPGSLVPRAEFTVVNHPGTPVRLAPWGTPIPLFLLGAALLGLFLGALGAVIRSTFVNTQGIPDASDDQIVSKK